MNALNIAEYTHTLGLQAKTASALMARAPAAIKNKALLALARLLRENVQALQADNAADLARARAAGLPEPMVDRLKLTPAVLETCALGCEQLAAMPDIIGEIIGMKQQPSGIRVGQMRVPIGVFGMIYESRPNVTIEAASLSIKSGNACILRGGSEAIDSNRALARLVALALAEAGLPEHGVQLVQTTDRAAVGQLIAMPAYVDVIIPRGGKGLIERISAEAKVPVIKHLDGICHVYVDDAADLDKATAAIFYSISNTQTGLRGVSFGDSLIKRVVETLRAEFPQLKVFATLSPIPGLRGWLGKHADDLLQAMPARARQALARELQQTELKAADITAALEKAAELGEKSAMRRWLLAAAARYLGSELTPDGRPLDAVARFHLGNGARVERLNWLADPSAKGLKQSYGLMVNYLYDLKRLDRHRVQLAQGQIPVSSAVQSQQD